MSKPIIILIRKPSNLEEVITSAKRKEGDIILSNHYDVESKVILSNADYDKMCKDFYADVSKLIPKEGGQKLSTHNIQVTKVQSPNRRDLYIDREGYEYARYVGIAI